MLGVRRTPPREEATRLPDRGRPVLLATIEVPFENGAAAFAVDSAVECGQPLVAIQELTAQTQLRIQVFRAHVESRSTGPAGHRARAALCFNV